MLVLFLVLICAMLFMNSHNEYSSCCFFVSQLNFNRLDFFCGCFFCFTSFYNEPFFLQSPLTAEIPHFYASVTSLSAFLLKIRPSQDSILQIKNVRQRTKPLPNVSSNCPYKTLSLILYLLHLLPISGALRQCFPVRHSIQLLPHVHRKHIPSLRVL